MFNFRPTDIDRYWSKVDCRSLDECWNYLAGKNTEGYGYFKLYLNSHDCVMLRAHRVAWEFTYGPIPEGMYVLHKCDNPACCNPNHLFLGKDRENADDKVSKSRQWRIYSEDIVRKIKMLSKDGLSDLTLARQFGMAASTVYKMTHGITWKYVTID